MTASNKAQAKARLIARMESRIEELERNGNVNAQMNMFYCQDQLEELKAINMLQASKAETEMEKRGADIMNVMAFI